MKQAKYVIAIFEDNFERNGYDDGLTVIGAANLDALTCLILNVSEKAQFRCFDRKEASKIGLLKRVQNTLMGGPQQNLKHSEKVSSKKRVKNGTKRRKAKR